MAQFAELTLRGGRRVLVNPERVAYFTRPSGETKGEGGSAVMLAGAAYPMQVQEAPDEVLRRLCFPVMPETPDQAPSALELAARAVLDATASPADWQAPYMRQLSQALAGEPTDERPEPGATAECEYCGETVAIDGSDQDVETTWQQWECPHCTRWNDKATD